MATTLSRIAEKAKTDPTARFTSLAHVLTPGFLKETWKGVNKQGAPGVDGVTAGEYAAHLDENVEDVVRRLKARQYRAPSVRRVDIPKGEGKTRPLGISTMEDRLVQRAVARILTAVYEPIFHDFSYGFRPGRSAHDALRELRNHIMAGGANWVYEADIRSYFNTINHEKLMEMLRQRIADPVILRLIQKWLRAGVMENGVVVWNERGTPQGGPISPVLANIYLHYALDDWFVTRVLPRLEGQAKLVRFADDYVVSFRYRHDAERFAAALPRQMRRYHLELAEEKTRLIEFGRYARENQERKGQQPETFDFLGFTHSCGTTRTGKYSVIRKPRRKSMRRFLMDTKAWLHDHMHDPPAKQRAALDRKLVGLYQYFGLWGCASVLHRVRWNLRRNWYQTLRRRGQKHRLTWEKFMRSPWSRLPFPGLIHPTV
jgi:RNA-directed DNA polymerase